ncbi:MAG: carboxylesterase/lipase family protein, partial [Oliverpabstia sp.]
MKKWKKWQKILVTVLLVLIILVIAALVMIRRMFTPDSIDAASADDQAIVETEKGTVRGSYEDGIYQYLGIPYSQVKKRFVASVEADAWSGILDATKCGPISPQSSILGMPVGSQNGTDDNCQNLNIWTPGIEDGEKRAVMVWFHGGGFSSGSANESQYNGEALSRYGDVVVVSVNHRLGFSGFLDLSAYGEQYQYSGNAGVTDMVNALQWIRDNIEHFGGDPDNVTLFGQSGGGAKVLALMTTPYAKGLFQRGIVQSGATETMGVIFTSQEASTKLTERILDKLGITDENIASIQNVSTSDLQKAANQAMEETAEEFGIPAPLSDGYAMEWGPVVDGDFIPTNPVTEEEFAESGQGVDLLIGSNLNEWTTIMGGDQGELTEEAVDAYEEAYPYKNLDTASKVDTLIRLPALKIMSHKADQGEGKVYAYVFAYDESG